MYKYLLFDADNTLLDFDGAEEIALKLTLEKCPTGFSSEIHQRYHIINQEEWEKLERKETTFERLKIERFSRLMEEFGFDTSLGAEVAKCYERELGNHAPLMPYAAEILELLSPKYEIFVITNGISKVQHARFEKTSINKYVKKLFISQEIGVSKPDKGFFDAVVASVGDSDLSRYLVIGDSLTSDIAGAYNYGMDSIWINSSDKTDSRPTYTVPDLNGVSDILQQ